MKIGLYFGSFNPIHHGHLIIAQYVLNTTDVDQVWFVVSPQNPFKHSKTLLNAHDRYHLVQLAIGDSNNLKANNTEFSLPTPSYTSVTLSHLSEKYKEHEFAIIMGSDSFSNIEKWKNYNYIIDNYNMYVYLRPNFPHSETNYTNVKFINAPLLDISSTYIRMLISEEKNIKYLVPAEVEEYILENKYYRKPK